MAVYSDADANARHVALADEAVRLGPASVAESYLKGDAIIAAAKATGAEAIHPGYGFLSENPEFVEAVEAAGLIFVGPSADAIRAMGLKDKAKILMEEAGVPVVPGYHGAEQDPAFLADQAAEIGYPVLIKARAGGGGKGMRLVERAEDFSRPALESAAREAEASFGDPAVLIEKYIQSPRHIEVQVFGDAHGNVVHLFERDCSLQRRHQKVIEEAPAPGMTEGVACLDGGGGGGGGQGGGLSRRGHGGVHRGRRGLSRPKAYWFMEMNTRLQVEHPVTEAITGLDLVALQLAVAEGAELPFAQEDLSITGHAFEARLYAEDPASGFPACDVGRLDRLRFGPGRADRHGRARRRCDHPPLRSDDFQGHHPWKDAREAALCGKLAMVLEGTRIVGVETNRDFLIRLARDEDFAPGRVDTGIDRAEGRCAD